MARGARSVSVRAERLSQAGCCVRAVVVFIMVVESSRRVVLCVCVFFFDRPRAGGEVAGEERCLNLILRCLMRRMRDSARTF